MAKQTGKTDKRGKRIFYILMLVVFFWFIATQLLGNSEQSSGISQADYVYQGQILWEKPDGSSEPITVPGKYDVAENETMVLTLQLPETYREQNLMIRSSLQDIRFYVDGKLRIEYDTSDTRIIGKNSASQYVFCPTSVADAGKEVRIELTTHTGKYAGVVNEIYCGDKSELWEYIFEKYGITMIIAFFLLFAGAVTIIFSIALGIVYHSKFDMEYLGWCILLAAAWMIGESKLRQLLVPNASALSQLCFLMIMLGPLPIIYYIDSIQNKRHWKLLRWMEYVTILDFVVCCMLHLTGMVDFIQTLPVSQGILAVILILVTGTVCYDLYHGYIRKNRYILVGLFVAVASVVVESLAVYFVVSISGIFIGIGMLVLFFVNLVRTISQVRDLERTRQQQELRKRRKQMETMSLQMIQTLATTIEAKDEYTRGHSHRVAEYSVLIAKELGWKQKDIFHLYNAAHLHDIGNIGIPDAILNKPARLTDEEYAVIKEHTIIGAEILKNITLVKHVVEVARSHHECYDGTGYPDGLKGEEIPIQARIVAVADSYDAMRSRRIYRNTLKSEVIYEQFQKNRGVQFDPEITDAFLRLLDEGRLVIEEEYAGANVEYGLTEAETEIEKFITNVISTMCTQEDSEGFDFLTGLPMRNRGEKLAAQFMQRYSGFLVFLDMDNLKKINDIYGHKAGDRALKLLGTLLSEYTHQAVVCRLGGDEFLMFMPECSREKLTEIVSGILRQFNENKEKDPEIRYASISAGICETAKGAPFEESYTKADKALYYVKQNGKGDLFFYDQMEKELIAECGTGKDLGMIAKALRESGHHSGTLNYCEFSMFYEYINSLGERHNYQCYLVMVTMDILPEGAMHIESIEEALACMEQSIQQKIRKVDICTRYSAMQYLIVLFEPDESQIPMVMDRIFMEYYKKCDRRNFIPRYEYRSILEDKDGDVKKLS